MRLAKNSERNILGDEEGVRIFDQIKKTAFDTSTSVRETNQRVFGLVLRGLEANQAVQLAAVVQRGIQETGIDLTDAYAKAILFHPASEEAQFYLDRAMRELGQ